MAVTSSSTHTLPRPEHLLRQILPETNNPSSPFVHHPPSHGENRRDRYLRYESHPSPNLPLPASLNAVNVRGRRRDRTSEANDPRNPSLRNPTSSENREPLPRPRPHESSPLHHPRDSVIQPVPAPVFRFYFFLVAEDIRDLPSVSNVAPKSRNPRLSDPLHAVSTFTVAQLPVTSPWFQNTTALCRRFRPTPTRSALKVKMLTDAGNRLPPNPGTPYLPIFHVSEPVSPLSHIHEPNHNPQSRDPTRPMNFGQGANK